jgi:hypothetical protein
MNIYTIFSHLDGHIYLKTPVLWSRICQYNVESVKLSGDSVKTQQEHRDTRKQLDTTRKGLERVVNYTFKALLELCENSVETQ